MIRYLIAKEILTNLLSLRLTFAFLMLLPLVSISVYVLCGDYAQRQEDYDAKVSLHKQAAATDRVRVDRPPSPLMALIGGVTVTTGNTIHLSYYDTPRIKGGFDHTPIFYIFPRTDYVFIIGIVMSLLALLFSYDAVAGEHERGTLRLVLSNAVPRDILLLSKWVGGYLSAFFPTMTALLLGMIVFAGHPAIDLAAADWWAIVFVLLTGWVYLAVFFSLGVLISAISPSVGNAAMRCLFIWLLFVLIIPNAAPHIARRFAPTPSIQEMERKYDGIVADIAKNRHEDHVVASKQVSNTEKPLRNISTNSAEYEEFQRIYWRIHCKILDIEHLHLTQQRYALRRIANIYESQLQKQARLANILSFSSPYAVFADVAMTLANTNSESQTVFLKMARQYEDDYFEQQYAEKRVIHHFLPVSDAPLFHLAVPSLQERMRQCLLGAGLLVLSGVFFFMAGHFLFLRRQV